MKNYSNIFKKARDQQFDFDFMPKTFGRMTVKRSEVVKPYLHYIDERRLKSNIETHMDNAKQIDKMYMKAFKNSRKINRQQLVEDTQAFYREDFPKEVASDIFNLYLKDPAKLDFETRGDSNKFRYKILDTVIDPVARVISKDSHLKSMVMTRSMVQYFSMLMAYQKQTDPEEFEKMKNALQNKSPKGSSGDQDDDEQEEQDDQEGDEQEQDDQQESKPADNNNSSSKKSGRGKSQPKGPMTPEQVLEKLMNNDKLDTLQDEILNEAKETIQQMSKISDDELDALYKSDSMEEGQEYNHESIMRIINQFLNLKMNMSKVKPIIQKLLDNSRNYFNGKETAKLVPFLDADTFDAVQDLELLHPKLRNFFLDDVMVKETKREGKIDVYIDVSGSMGSMMMYNNNSISGIDFAKSFAIQMLNMRLVRKVYLFDTSITEINATPLAISTANYGGGTYINTVVNHIEKERHNALVLTDACDSCNTYSSLVYFIGIVGADFKQFDSEVMKNYANRQQAVEFDGTNVYNIDARGRRII
jgi:flagellar motor protein MotB